MPPHSRLRAFVPALVLGSILSAAACASRPGRGPASLPPLARGAAAVDFFEGRVIDRTLGEAAVAEILVKSYSTPDEIRAFKRLVDSGRADEFLKAFRSTDKGTVRITGAGARIRVHAAQTVPTAQGRRVEIFGEGRIFPWSTVRRADPTAPYLVIVLDLDTRDEGDGVIYESARVALRPQGAMALLNGRITPRLLAGVRRVGGTGLSRAGAAAPAPVAAPPEERDDAEAGLWAVDTARDDEAVAVLDRAIAADPLRAGLRWRKGFALLRLGRLEEAAAAVRDEAESRPGNWSTWTLLAFIERRRGRAAEAEAACVEAERILAAVGTRPRRRGAAGSFRDGARTRPEVGRENAGLAALIHAEILESRRDFAAADAEYGRALSMGADPAAVLLRRVRTAGERGGPAEAEKAAAGFLRSEGDHPGLFTLLAKARAARGNRDGAREALVRAVALKPYDDDLQRTLAAFELAAGDRSGARLRLERAALLDPFDERNRTWLDRARSAAPNAASGAADDIAARAADEAAAAGDSIVDEESIRFDYRPVHDAGGVVRMVGDRFFEALQSADGGLDRAADLLARYLEYDDESPGLMYNAAQALGSLGRTREAFAWAARALEMQPNDRDTLDLCAGLYFRAKLLDQAVPLYERALRADPADAMAHYNLGCAYEAAGRGGDAVKEWRETIRVEKVPLGRWLSVPPLDPASLSHSVLVQQEPVSFAACMALGRHLKGSQTAEALKYYTNAAQLKPSAPEPYLELARLLATAGDRDKARAYAQKFVDLGGDRADVADLLDRK